MRLILSLALFLSAVSAKPLVIASVYPIYDFVSVIAKDEISVNLLVGPNIDPHSFEPTPANVVAISKADMFFYISPNFEPWAQKFGARAKRSVSLWSQTIHVCNHDHGHNHEHESRDADPHVWLDPEKTVEIITRILSELVVLLPEKSQFFEDNAAKLLHELAALDKKFFEILQNAQNDKVFFAGHNSFSVFARRYELNFIPINPSFSSSSEPSARQMARFIDEIRKSGVRYIYYDALKKPAAALAAARETGVEILPLFSVHTVSPQDFADRVSFVEFMRRNYENLARGL